MSDLTKIPLFIFPDGGGRLTEWGKNIRRLRIIKNTDLIQMAQHLGVSIGYLSGVECGRKPQDPDFMKRCEDYLNSLPTDEKRVRQAERAKKAWDEYFKKTNSPEHQKEYQQEVLGTWDIEEKPKSDKEFLDNFLKDVDELQQKVKQSRKKAFEK